MYKYTYLLSQSYRTDTAHLTDNYQSIQRHSNYPQSNSVHSKNHPKIVSHSSSKFNNQAQGHIQHKNIQRIGMKYKLQGRQYQAKTGQLIHNKIHNSKQVKNNFDGKIKEIAQKYSHNGYSKNPISNEIKRQHFTNKTVNNENKSYHQYKSQKSNPYIANLKREEIATKDSQQTILKQKRLNSLHEQEISMNRHPFQQPTINRFISETQQQHNINRTRIKSQVSSYIEGRANRDNNNGIAKKYNYPIEKQAIPIPVSQKNINYQQGETVSKLSSLQQKIKSLVGSHVPY